jgi:hypothetical protein
MAAGILSILSGCYVETSKSGNGITIIGKYATLPGDDAYRITTGGVTTHLTRWISRITGNEVSGDANTVVEGGLDKVISKYFSSDSPSPQISQKESNTQEICGITLPKTINVGCFTIKIKSVEDLSMERGLYGEYCHRNRLITIDSKCNSQQAWETYHHELMECINIIYNIGMEHNQISLVAVGLAHFRFYAYAAFDLNGSICGMRRNT